MPRGPITQWIDDRRTTPGGCRYVMVEFSFKDIKNILCLGAHSDDIEIGCGATLLKLIRDHDDLTIWWIVFSAEGGRSREARASANAFLKGVSRKKIVVKQFRGSFFPYDGEQIKKYFEEIKGSFRPDLVFTHYRNDRHQDHRVLSDLAWNTFRNHLILEYEIPEIRRRPSKPECLHPWTRRSAGRRPYIVPVLPHPVQQALVFRKRHSCLSCGFGECASPTNYAEAFFCRKWVGA
jgi:LmbE family N-acetylglucosaminyl deacetylase